MANLSLKTIGAAYVALSKISEDPTAQGATQVVSALRYLIALDKFYKAFKKNCDTRNSIDKNNFNRFVGDVCHICDSKGVKYYTSNFYLPLKEHNGDYSVGSNFYSTGQVKVSLTNNGTLLVYPQRGNYPLFNIQNGVLLYNEEYVKNISHYLPTPTSRVAMAIWLSRYKDLPIDKNDLSGENLLHGLYKSLLNDYSENLVEELLGDKEVSQILTNQYPISYTPKQCVVLEPKNIEQLFPLYKPQNVSNNQVITSLNQQDLSKKLLSGFKSYFLNYLRLSTGKQDDSKFDTYLDSYKKQIEQPIKEKFKDFSSIFTFSDTISLNNFFSSVSKEIPNLSILLTDKWPQEKDKQTIYYEPWTMVRHYKAYLDLLQDLNQVFVNIKPIKASLQPLSDVEKAVNYSAYLAAMRTKPFLLLAGISGTGKSRIVKEMAFASCPPSLQGDEVTPGNYCMIEVKPNWHDSTELIGYESHINGDHYVVTPFVNFLIKALHYPKAPFFVCLDEMNLAPVEQYFAEFLSVLESRKLVNGEIVSEPLIKPEIFRNYFDDFKKTYFSSKLAPSGLVPEQFADLWKDLGDYGLRLPANVIVVGTVNMDETTYQFSRKVIDRAMTMEMNEVDFDSMFAEKPDTLKYRDQYVHAEHFLPKYAAAKDALANLSDDDREYLKANVPELLNSLDEILKTTPFRIAYRVENELLLYFTALREEKPDAEASPLLTSAVDDILMMKVLPRVEGGEDTLGDDGNQRGPLSKLEAFATEHNYTKAAEKIAEMKARLAANHFTSFWP